MDEYFTMRISGRDSVDKIERWKRQITNIYGEIKNTLISTDIKTGITTIKVIV